MAYIVTGRTGTPHVSSADDAAFNRAVVGPGDYVIGNNILTVANLGGGRLRVGKCEVSIQGHHCRVEGNEEFTIPATSQGVKRKDLICGRYNIDSNGIESFGVVHIMGTPAANPVAPAIASTDLTTSSGARDMAFAEVTVSGSDIVSIDGVATMAPDIQTLGTATDGALSDVRRYVNDVYAEVRAHGSIVESALPAETSIARGTANDLVTVVVPAGVWSIDGYVTLKRISSTRFVSVGLSDSAGVGQDRYLYRERIYGASGTSEIYKIPVHCVRRYVASTSIHLTVSSTINDSILGDGSVEFTGLRAVRIGF